MQEGVRDNGVDCEDMKLIMGSCKSQGKENGYIVVWHNDCNLKHLQNRQRNPTRMYGVALLDPRRATHFHLPDSKKRSATPPGLVLLGSSSAPTTMVVKVTV